jgi:hypothetical protein
MITTGILSHTDYPPSLALHEFVQPTARNAWAAICWLPWQGNRISRRCHSLIGLRSLYHRTKSTVRSLYG